MDPRDLYPGLPDPLQASDPALQEKLNSIAVQDHVAPSRGTKRKRAPGGNHKYTPEVKLEVAKDAVRIGNTAAAKKWSTELGHRISESTVRNWKRSYLDQLDDGPVEGIIEKKKGRPTKLPDDCDKVVRRNMREQYRTGTNVSTQKALAIGQEVLRKKHPNLVNKIKLSRAWAQSLFRRMNFVFRKVTRASRQPPEDMEAAKTKYLKQIRRAVRRHSIPKRLIINIDQVGLQLVPRSDFSMAPRGATQVCQVGAKDKRTITGVLGCTLKGQLLPPQMIYSGKTDRCHPVNEFPPGWHITHNETHWADGETMKDYLKEVLIPYIETARSNQNYDEDQKALLILDTFAAHCTDELKEAMDEANIVYVYVPPGTTDFLQPLDAAGSVNYCFKKRVKARYNEHLSSLVYRAMDEEGNLPPGWAPDMRMSVIKPLHADWIQESWLELKAEKHLIKIGWEKTGIQDAIQDLYMSNS